MNPYSIPPLISSIVFLFLGVFIYFQDRRSKINLTFLFASLSTFWWQFSWVFLFNTRNEALANILIKVGHIGIILLPVTFFHFVISFLEKNDKFNKITLYLAYLITILFEASLFTSYFVNGYFKYYWGFYPKVEFLHPFFLLFIAILLTRGIYLLFISKKEVAGSFKRFQIDYIIVAIIFYVFSSSDFLANYGFEFYPLGFIPILFFLGSIGYAIAKYKLMNVKVILTEFLVFITGVILLIEVFLTQSFSGILIRLGIFLSFCFLGWLLIKSVLNEVKRREELQRLYEEVDKLSKTKSEFISIASHQLRTPLTAIKGYISMIIEGTYGQLSKDVKTPLGNVYESNERLIRLVNDLLNLSRLEAGRITLSPEPMSLEEMVTSIVNELKINSENKGLYIKTVLPEPPLGKVMADPDKLRQVVLNIVDNAIKYTKEGGLTVEVSKRDSVAQVKISDTGMGMEEKEIKSLFQMFTRASAGTQLHTAGAGIGLYVARQFIEMHKGKIWAESEGEGKGSTFFIQLPINN